MLASAAAEKRRRQKAVDFARSNIGLEGFTITEKLEAFAQRYIDGEIDLDEFAGAKLSNECATPADRETP